MTNDQQNALEAIVSSTDFYLLEQHQQTDTTPSHDDIQHLASTLTGIVAAVNYIRARGFTTPSQLAQELNGIAAHWYKELSPYIDGTPPPRE